MSKLKESDIQKYIYGNLASFPSLIGFRREKRKYQPNKNDILNKPLKYLISKNYNYFSKIFENWESHYEEFIHKFEREFNTAENGDKGSYPKMDIFVIYNDKEELNTNFIIFEIKNDESPTRQTLTELLQYSNGLQMQDFPGLENDKVCFIIISKDWTNILIQSVVNGILFKGLNILPLKISHDGKNPNTIKINIFDLYDKVVREFGKKIIQKKFYKSRVLCFGNPYKQNIAPFVLNHWEHKILSMTISNKLEKEGYNGFVLFTETDGNIKYPNIYKNCVIIATFDWGNEELKEWSKPGKNKKISKKQVQKQELYSLEIDYTFSTKYIKNILNQHFLSKDVVFDKGKGGCFSELSEDGWSFSHGTSFGFLRNLHEDLINYLHEDLDFRLKTIGSDDIEHDEIFNWQIIDRILK